MVTAPMASGLNIGIAGCGIGGMAAALFLHRQGHEITLFDQFSSPTPVGSGLVIQPVGQYVLNELGIGEAILKAGQPIYSMSGIESQSRRNVLNVDYGPPNGPTFGLGIHRSTLFDALYQAVLEAKLALYNHQLIRNCELSSKSRFLTNSKSERFGPFDLVIDASGAGSALSPIKARPLSYGALWGTVDWPKTSSGTALPQTQLSQSYCKAHNMLGVLPIGRMPGSQTMKAAIFWSEKTQNLPDWPVDGLQAWKDQAVKLWPEFLPFIEQIKTPSQMTRATYRHGTLWRPYEKRLAYIGDAAHQASPQLGQGANMALLDAQALAQAVQVNDLDAALKAYARRRRMHVYLYQLFSAVFTPFYQSDSHALPVLRDYVMNPLSLVWPVKPMLTKLVCGNLIKP